MRLTTMITAFEVILFFLTLNGAQLGGAGAENGFQKGHKVDPEVFMNSVRCSDYQIIFVILEIKLA